MKYPILCVALLTMGSIFLSGCMNRTSKPTTQQEVQLVGNDRDEHGCIASAGYQWSELKQACIRPFEEGIRLSAQKADESIDAGYLVFNGDSTKVEVFIHHPKSPLILDLGNTSPKEWSKTGSPLKVRCDNGQWSLSDGEQILYK